MPPPPPSIYDPAFQDELAAYTRTLLRQVHAAHGIPYQVLVKAFMKPHVAAAPAPAPAASTQAPRLEYVLLNGTTPCLFDAQTNEVFTRDPQPKRLGELGVGALSSASVY